MSISVGLARIHPCIAYAIRCSLIILVFTWLLSAVTVHAAEDCSGKYKDGSRPQPHELVALLEIHSQWLDAYTDLTENKLYKHVNGYSEIGMANLCNANLSGLDLRGAKLRGANLRNAHLRNANLRQADLLAADLGGADLRGANLSGAILVDADLTASDLRDADLRFAMLSDAKIHGADVSRTSFAISDIKLAGRTSRLPNMESLSGARHLAEIRIQPDLQTVSEFVALREEFKRNGKRDQERAVTAALKRMEAQKGNAIERSFLLLAFDLPTEYGASPGRPLRILLILVLVFAVPYMVALATPRGDGIWRIWQPDRIEQHIGTDHPVRLHAKGVGMVGIALQFSILSAASIGWRDINFGNWITRIQPNEYTLRATGWVRSVSGTQSLVSVYLIALWALTYFGRPFE